VWFDDRGPCAAVVLTDWGELWQADALVVRSAFELDVVWDALLTELEAIDAPIEVFAGDDDHDLLRLLERDGFAATDEVGGTTWMDAADRPPVDALPDGYRIVDRTERVGRSHPMAARNGDEVEARLHQGSLYDPWLDLGVETADGSSAGYALYWFDEVTGAGMLEPMRVEDEHQRRGLGRCLLTEGLDRLARRGAQRVKVAFAGEAGRNLYLGAGFVLASTETTYRR
jgi:predicted N-acetyltransferase YhbS